MDKSRQDQQITINNEKGTRPISVGAQYVMPGEVRTFPWHEVPTHLRPMEAAPAVVVPDPAAERRAFLKGLLEGPEEQLTRRLPDPSLEDLQIMEELENASAKPRKQLLEAIAGERLAIAGRAEEKAKQEALAAAAKAKEEADAKAQAEADEKAKAEADAKAQAEAEAAAAIEKRKGELAELRTQSVKNVHDHFSELSDQDLVTLKELEQAAETPRKTLLDLIAEEMKQRAGAGAG